MRVTPTPRAAVRAALAATLAATLAAVPARGAHAQPAAGPDPAPVPTGVRACVRALPDSAFHRTPVFLHAEVVDSADARARSSVDLVAQEVGTRVRALLRGAPDGGAALRLPAADSVLGGRVYPEGGLRLVARRGGRLAWRVDVAPDADSAPVRLVERALREVHADSPLMVPDVLIRGDSVAFVLDFAQPYPTGPGGRLEIKLRNPTPVFTAALPTLRQARARAPRPYQALRYPPSLQVAGYEGRVQLAFVIDTTGRAIPRTLRDAAPGALAALAPGPRGAYHDFFVAARDAVLREQYVPAALGGCPVRQLVKQQIGFTLAR